MAVSMALLAGPRLLFGSHVQVSDSVSVFASRRWRRLSVRSSNAPGAVPAEGGGPALVWFKRDLRVDDHPGLIMAASRHRVVVPLYVFDHRVLRCELMP